MKRRMFRTRISSLLIVIAFVSMGFFGICFETEEVSAAGPTEVSGSISTNTTWLEANSPYIVTGNVLVNQNVNLTINAGVTVKFKNNTYLRIDGKLFAVGTESQMISFTSDKNKPISGDWGGIRFENTGSDSVLKYCKIEYGGGKYFGNFYYGGGIYNNINNLKISNCIFENNSADNGGGISNSGSVELNSCTFLNNSAAQSGGGINNSKGIITLVNCLISKNYGGVGGGIILDGGSASIINSKISENVCLTRGGGIYSYDGSAFLSNCTIEGNFASYTGTGGGSGGGICNADGCKLTIEFCIITGNNVTNKGGGIWNFGPMNITTSVISNNSDYGIHGDDYWGDTSISYCSIINNSAGGIKDNPSKLEFTNLNNPNYNIYLISSTDVNAPNNWWGTTNTNLINQSIYDFYDDYDLGKVNYLPVKISLINISNVTTPNRSPLASAGPDQNVTVNQVVILNGSGSYDPNADPLTYKWDFGDGISTGWLNSNITTHIYNKTGDYTVTLTVSDSFFTVSDTCVVHVKKVNQSPIANAGPDQNVKVNQTVHFDASNSSDEDDDTLTYKWYFGDGSSTGWVNSSKTSHSYKKAGNYTVVLTVSDGLLADNDTCIIHVLGIVNYNSAPIANAGPDQNIAINQIIYFDGGKSTDPDGDPLTYKWNFGDGNSTKWQSSSNTSHIYSKPGVYTVTLTVSDGQLNDTDSCSVRVSGPGGDKPPTIKDIPDMNIHWWNPGDPGYGYDFSYFISDPDNNDSELTIWASTGDDEKDKWIENDPDNNMKLIFKFPFSAGNKIPVALYVVDSQAKQAYKIFNINVISDSWPVEMIKSIPDQQFNEDDRKDNAIDLDNYFKDLDGGTSYEIHEDTHDNLNAVIDVNNFIDLSSNVKDWNTGDGFVELVILAKDSKPEQYVYAEVKVKVILVEDPIEKLPNYYKIIVNEVVSGSLILSELKFKCYTENELVLFETNILNAEPSFILSGQSKIYAIPSSTIPITDSVGELQNGNDRMPEYNNCLLAIIDLLSDGNMDFGDTIWIYKDNDNDSINEVTPGCKLKIFDKNYKEIVEIELPEDNVTDLVIKIISEGKGIDKTDSDNDLIPDAWELLYGLDPNNSSDALLDLDNDSLTNLQEYLKGTNPLKYDTDGDGYSDKDDAYPTNPNKYKKETPRSYLLEISVVLGIIIILIIIASLKLFILKPKRHTENIEQYDENLLNTIREKILNGEPIKELEISSEQIEKMLKYQFENGMISSSTYNFIKSNILHDQEPPRGPGDINLKS